MKINGDVRLNLVGQKVRFFSLKQFEVVREGFLRLVTHVMAASLITQR